MTKIVLIEDDPVIRAGITYLVGDTSDFQIAGWHASVEDALPHLRKDNPDIILLDIELPGMRGTDAIPKIKDLVPYAAVIILSVYDSEPNVFTALKNGAAGYLVKNDLPQKLIPALRDFLSGAAPLSASISKMVVGSFQLNNDSPLTKRETEILSLFAEGKNRRKIAEEMFIDMQTVKTHLRNIYAKLNVHSRDEALKKARSEKYI